MSWYSDRRFIMTLVLWASFMLFALKATSNPDDSSFPTSAYVQTSTTRTTPVQRLYKGQGICILMDANGLVR